MQSHPIHTRHHPHVTAEPVAPALRTDAVGIDAHGNSVYHDVQLRAREKLEELYARL